MGKMISRTDPVILHAPEHVILATHQASGSVIVRK